MRDALPLEEDQWTLLNAILDAGEEHLQKVANSLNGMPPKPMRLQRLDSQLSSLISDNSDFVERILQLSVYLHGWVRGGGFDQKEVFEGLSKAVENNSDWKKERITAWLKIAPIVLAIVANPVIRLSVAANELIFERQRTLQSARILTDIRPVFSPDVTSIDASVISHLLRVVFLTNDGAREELEIAMDESDVELLASQCDRAREKGALALQVMNEKANVPSMIAGELENE